ncbi:MAG: hypothetical protein HYU57_08000 [Micavibrio aeruginosavorus]|nr:hypothetical protein [Micavibrio aeruginosavorus]
MAQYSHEELMGKLEGVQPFDPAENLMGVRGKPVIAEMCAANGIGLAKPEAPQPAPEQAPQNNWNSVLKA